MYNLVIVLLFIACILLILIVLVQNSKGGGLASNFQASNQIMGVRKTADFLEKATWVLAGALLILSIAGSAIIAGENNRQAVNESILKDKIENVVDPNQVPSFPAAEAPKSTTAPVTAPTTATPAATTPAAPAPKK
jgi:preprotein translocase subunit SecG